MNPTTIATAADYADAMLTARRAKRILVTLILLMLIAQVTIFALVQFKVLDINDATMTMSPGEAAYANVTPSAEATTQPASTQPAEGFSLPSGLNVQAKRLLTHYGTSLSVFIGMVCSILLAVVLLLLLIVMLVGRLIGVSQVTSALLWAVVLGLILFPWQVFFAEPGYTGDDPRIPGALYTWTELTYYANSMNAGNMDGFEQGLKWTRFVGFPVLAMILVLVIQSRSSRGLRMALGETDVSVTVDEHPHA